MSNLSLPFLSGIALAFPQWFKIPATQVKDV